MADLRVHDPDPGVHDRPIGVFTLVRNAQSVDAFRVVVFDVFPEQPSQVILTYDDHMIE
jgi:hypothetical protein